MSDDAATPTPDLERLTERFDHALGKLEDAPVFAKLAKVGPVLDTAKRVLLQQGGPAVLEARAARLEASGVFAGTDWEHPQHLDPSLTPTALRAAEASTVVIESLSELRLVAVATGALAHPTVTPEDARAHVTQVLAINMSLIFGPPTEADRERQGRLALVSRAVLRHVADRVGYQQVLGQLVEEIWRILMQRPIQVQHVKDLITEIAIYRNDPDIDLRSGTGADRLITSLYGTTLQCREDPGVDIYLERLGTLDRSGLQSEASGFARAMHDTGLVSPYHAVLVRFLVDHDDQLLADALGLTAFGRDSLTRHRELVHRLIDEAVAPPTAQGVYGLALMLERGILYQRPIAPALWRQLRLTLSEPAKQRIRDVYGEAAAPRSWLLSGILSMLGLPLGIGQGDNPTCQSARALSMWAENDPDYLLEIVANAVRDDEVVAHFEGQRISSREVASGVAASEPIDLDPVSLLVVPHLDRIYAEMGRRCLGREGDPHRWVNPEFHGWWAWRGFRINVDVATGKLMDLEGFLRDLHAAYHPAYNGDQPLIHPQPAGLAVTDTAGRFVGWHAIALLRVAADPSGEVRFYFYNPNDDGGQDWGDGVAVGTSGNGERFGESSLAFTQLASRLYIFHYDAREEGEPSAVPQSQIQPIVDLVHRTWGADRLPEVALQASAGSTDHAPTIR